MIVMTESHSLSKLKRKKSSVEDQLWETSSRRTKSRSPPTVSSSDMSAQPGRSVVPAAVWWNREQLPAVESLWVLTLKSALPNLENQHCHLVPDLPHPSTERPTALKDDEQRWCDLSEEVAPFPEPSQPSLRTSLSPDPLSSSQQDLSVPTKPVPDPADTQLSSHSRQSQNGRTTSLQALTKRLQPSLHSWDGAASSAGPSSVRGKQGQEPGPVNRQSDRSEKEEEGVEDREEEEVQRTVGGEAVGGGDGGLQSCPMCLLVFPVGFTQMDCDGHLAQCLSEVNVDMTW